MRQIEPCPFDRVSSVFYKEHMDTLPEILTPGEVDRTLRYPSGRAARLARQGKLDFVRLPDGEIRFRREDIERILKGADHAD